MTDGDAWDDIARRAHSERTPSSGSGSAISVRDMVLQHDRAIDDLNAWRSELRGAMALVRLTLGASLLSAAASIVAIIAVLGGAK